MDTYWEECVLLGAEECGLDLTPEQVKEIAASVEAGHENYGMAFYSPPASDRLGQIEREWRAKYQALQVDFDRYRENAEGALRRGLRLRHDANISIERNGDVVSWNGRSDIIL